MDKLLQLHPVLRRKVEAILSDLAGHGFPAVIGSAWRSKEEQAVLHKHGFSKVLFSFHNATYPGGRPCALAADIVARDTGWGAPGVFWLLLARTRQAHGLHACAPWDKAHVQLLPNKDLARVQAGWLPSDSDEEHWP